MTDIAARRGDEDAFEALYRRHLDAVHHYSLECSADPLEAEDVAQTTFLEALQVFALGYRPRAAKEWLLATASRVVRESAGEPTEHEALTEGIAAVEAGDRGRQAEVVANGLRGLSPLQRAALMLVEIDGRSPAEACAELGIPSTYIHSLLAQARQNLRTQIVERMDCERARSLQPSLVVAGKRASERRAAREHLRHCDECKTVSRRWGAGLPGLVIPGLRRALSLAARVGHHATTLAARAPLADSGTVAGKAAVLTVAGALAGGVTWQTRNQHPSARVRVAVPVVTHRAVSAAPARADRTATPRVPHPRALRQSRTPVATHAVQAPPRAPAAPVARVRTVRVAPLAPVAVAVATKTHRVRVKSILAPKPSSALLPPSAVDLQAPATVPATASTAISADPGSGSVGQPVVVGQPAAVQHPVATTPSPSLTAPAAPANDAPAVPAGPGATFQAPSAGGTSPGAAHVSGSTGGGNPGASRPVDDPTATVPARDQSGGGRHLGWGGGKSGSSAGESTPVPPGHVDSQASDPAHATVVGPVDRSVAPVDASASGSPGQAAAVGSTPDQAPAAADPGTTETSPADPGASFPASPGGSSSPGGQANGGGSPGWASDSNAPGHSDHSPGHGQQWAQGPAQGVT